MKKTDALLSASVEETQIQSADASLSGALRKPEVSYSPLSGAASTPALEPRNAQGETSLQAAIMDFWAVEAQRGVTQEDLDRVIAAVRQSPPVPVEENDKDLSRSDPGEGQ